MATKKTAKGSSYQPKSGQSKSGARPAPRNTTPPTTATPPPPPPDEEADPPIIIGGGSVTITSKYFLDASYDSRTGLYTYSTGAVKVGKIKTKGKKDEEDESDNGKFTIELFEG